MSIVINTNTPALKAAHHVRTTVDGMNTAMERLSSGKRINSSADDAAGVSIAAKLTSQIRGLNMAIRNAEDAMSAYKVAEGAYIEVENMLQRIRELAVQKASGTYSGDDDNAINAEMDALVAEINDINNNTEFNDINIGSGPADFAPADKDGGNTSMAVDDITLSIALTNGSSVGDIDNAITEITSNRGTLGAYVNRLEYRVNNYSNISANTAAARSRIEDADFAAESANLAKFQVLQQAGTAMLAQANAAQQTVLRLIQ